MTEEENKGNIISNERRQHKKNSSKKIVPDLKSQKH